VGKNSGNLEGTNHAHARDLRGPGGSDVLFIEQDLARSGDQELGQQVEASRFAGAIGTDQGVDMATLDFQIHIINGRESFELLGQIPCFQDEARHHVSRLFFTTS
jgi:hypothetical protein